MGEYQIKNLESFSVHFHRDYMIEALRSKSSNRHNHNDHNTSKALDMSYYYQSSPKKSTRLHNQNRSTSRENPDFKHLKASTVTEMPAVIPHLKGSNHHA